MKLRTAPAVKRVTRGPAPRLSLDQDDWLQAGLSAFLADGPVHEASIEGPWALDSMEHDLGDCLVRGSRTYQVPEPGNEDEGEQPRSRRSYVFQLEEHCWLHVGLRWARLYARDPRRVEALAEGLIAAYRRPPAPERPTFCLLKQTSCGIETEEIPLSESEAANDSALELLYGEGFLEWHHGFVEKFRQAATGISVFEGPPGTGKTSYIRHLMRVLVATHRFYFIPSANFDVLRDSEFVDFWAGERRCAQNRQLVVILEDAEAVLVTRKDDNRREVSVLLNITDGILGEFLRLQVIGTVNCDIHELDPALLRPGRLVARRHFGRLSPADARKLARAKGLDLPTDEHVSLAEIFGGQAGDADSSMTTRRIGFAVEEN